MAQRDKVKELVGRGLHSYHTKALQQMDRIEKKNKEQNHKINILTNELDNDYLTKTEEGSVVSLEHSKEGMVYLDELQGNTLVNYCSDGSKEMTLNGDIDVEGTFVTTTEGVDNGLIDVICEGNTLVNLVKGHINGGVSNGAMIFNNTYRSYYTDMIKPNTTYTIITYKNGNRHLVCESEEFSETTNFPLTTLTTQINDPSDYIVTKVTTSGNAKYLYLYSTNNSNFGAKVLFLEGDWTNKPIPPYFEGMKSVGQDDINGHKIEILSQNKNLYSYETMLKDVQYITKLSDTSIKVERTNPPSYSYHGKDISEYLINGKTYSLRADISNTELGTYGIDITRRSDKYREQTNVLSFVADTNKYIYTLKFYCNKSSTEQTGLCSVTYTNIQLEYGNTSTSVVSPKINKKEISLNEPLRSTSKVKDRFVKIGNKWFIERNCKVQTLNGSEGWSLATNNNHFICSQIGTDALGSTNIAILCDKINVTTRQILDNGEGYGINLSYYLRINLRDCDAKNGATVEQFIQRLQDNPVTIIYPLKTPIYEPLEINPELITYLDTTHISNNSLIPCNMKIQNTGYNAIIKPSTLYTIAIDTNKSGTIGINLGGAKVTTTNSVVTITTPATLTDDSLRLYGKGIKGSKIRLLEGDKTNWIPSHFEGMKSSFEDKFDKVDNCYKMEILSNNENLIPIPDCYVESSQSKSLIEKPYKYNELAKSLNGKTVTVSAYVKGENIQPIEGMATHYGLDIKFKGGGSRLSSGNIWLSLTKGTLPHTGNFEGRYSITVTFGNETHIDGFNGADLFLRNMTGKLTMRDITITVQNNKEFIPNKSNKIQFSSIEPLRGIGDVKDRFVFKDGKLMIERNTKQTILIGDESEGWSHPASHTTSKQCLLFSAKKTNEPKEYSKIYSDRFMTPNELNAGDTTLWQLDREGIGHTIYNDVRIRIDRKRLATPDRVGFIKWLSENPTKIVYELEEPTYEEIPYELQKIILEGYENGTLFFDTNIPPTSTVTYAGETPIVKSIKSNKVEVENNTTDINDNIIPYLMDMDYRVVCLELAGATQGVSMARLFGGVYEMLKRDILSKRLSRQEYGYRLADYFNAGKLTEEQVRELEDLR